MDFITANPVAISLAIFFLIVIIALAIKSSLNPFVPVKALLTPAELNFYKHLIQVTPSEVVVCFKVRIADVVEVKPSITGKSRIRHFNKIAAKHFDFVLVKRSDMKIIAAIELNDSSHQRPDRKRRDELVRSVMQSAKLPLIEIKAARNYNNAEIKAAVDQAINTPGHNALTTDHKVDKSHAPGLDTDVLQRQHLNSNQLQQNSEKQL